MKLRGLSSHAFCTILLWGHIRSGVNEVSWQKTGLNSYPLFVKMSSYFQTPLRVCGHYPGCQWYFLMETTGCWLRKSITINFHGFPTHTMLVSSADWFLGWGSRAVLSSGTLCSFPESNSHSTGILSLWTLKCSHVSPGEHHGPCWYNYWSQEIKREHANNPVIDNMTLCCFASDLYSFHLSVG